MSSYLADSGPTDGIGAVGAGALNTTVTRGVYRKTAGASAATSAATCAAALSRAARPGDSASMSSAASRKGSAAPPETLYPCGGVAFERQNALTSGSGTGFHASIASWNSPLSSVPVRNVRGVTKLTVTRTPIAASWLATSCATVGRGLMFGTARVNASWSEPRWRTPSAPATHPLAWRTDTATAGEIASIAAGPTHGIPAENGPVWMTPPRLSNAPATTADLSMATPMAWRTTESARAGTLSLNMRSTNSGVVTVSACAPLTSSSVVSSSGVDARSALTLPCENAEAAAANVTNRRSS